MNMEINTLKKFLDTTKLNRGDNYPSVRKLKLHMEKLKVNEELQIDIMSFFLYDHESE